MACMSPHHITLAKKHAVARQELVEKYAKVRYVSFDDAITEDRLRKSLHHCGNGKRDQNNVIKYEMENSVNITRLYKHLCNGTHKMNRLNRFVIYEPKKRNIIADGFEDKVIQYCVAKNCLEPLIMPRLIVDNYASQPEQGSMMAIYRLQRMMYSFAQDHNFESCGYVMSGDIKKFFYNIDQDVCYKQLCELPMDDRLKKLIRMYIYACTPELNEYTDEPHRGLCIGFQTSQWLAIYYLNGLDHFIKEELGIKYYGRYMDDFILMHESKEYLEYCWQRIDEYLRNVLHLRLNKKTHIHPFDEGVCFLGYRCTYDEFRHQVDIRIRKKSIRKMYKRMKKLRLLYLEDKITKKDIYNSLDSWHAYAQMGDKRVADNAYRKAEQLVFGRKVIDESDQLMWTNPEYRDIDGFYILVPTEACPCEAFAKHKQPNADEFRANYRREMDEKRSRELEEVSKIKNPKKRNKHSKQIAHPYVSKNVRIHQKRMRNLDSRLVGNLIA